ncbi:MAG: DUF5522 domain-containing protein [Actinomycetota bacterium]
MTDESEHPGGWQDAHDTAVAAGQDGYFDPTSGLFVMTERYLLHRGTCCGSGCRHCPYDGGSSI